MILCFVSISFIDSISFLIIYFSFKYNRPNVYIKCLKNNLIFQFFNPKNIFYLKMYKMCDTQTLKRYVLLTFYFKSFIIIKLQKI